MNESELPSGNEREDEDATDVPPPAEGAPVSRRNFMTLSALGALGLTMAQVQGADKKQTAKKKPFNNDLLGEDGPPPRTGPAKAAEKAAEDPLAKLRQAIQAEGGHVDEPQLHLMGKEHLAPNGIAPIGYRPRLVNFTRSYSLQGNGGKGSFTFYGAMVRTMGDFAHISSHAKAYVIKGGRPIEVDPKDLQHSVVQSKPHGNSYHQFVVSGTVLRGASGIRFDYGSKYLEPIYPLAHQAKPAELAAYAAEFPGIDTVTNNMVGNANPTLQQNCGTRAETTAKKFNGTVPYKLFSVEGYSTEPGFDPSVRNAGHIVVCAHSGNKLALLDPQISARLAKHGAVPYFIPTGITMENTIGRRNVGGSNMGRYFHTTGMTVGNPDIVRVATADTRFTEAELAYAEAIIKLRNEKAYGGADIRIAAR